MKLLSVFLGIVGYMLSNITPYKVNTTDTTALSSTPQWQINISNGDSFSSQWDIPTINNYNVYKGKRPPQEVINYAKQLATQYGIETAAILAACYHERGIKNWYDDFLCGFGATDDLNWNKSRFGGWKKQIRLFAKRASRCGYFKLGINITSNHAQNFARYCYKTTAWQNYGRIATYIKQFNHL